MVGGTPFSIEIGFEITDREGRAHGTMTALYNMATGDITFGDSQPTGQAGTHATHSPSPAPSPCAHCGSDERSTSPCGSCLQVSYCSKACQAADWTQGGHKAQCRKAGLAGIDEALQILGGRRGLQELVNQLGPDSDAQRLALPPTASSALEKLVALTWAHRTRRPDGPLLHLCALELLVESEAIANELGLRSDECKRRIQRLLRRALAEIGLPALTKQTDDACVAYINLVNRLATFGERPREAAALMKVAYSQVEASARLGTADVAWRQLAPALLLLTRIVVQCAEEAMVAKDHALSRAYLTEAKAAGMKVVKLLTAQSVSGVTNVGVSTSPSMAESLSALSCKLVKLHAPELGTLFARAALDLATSRNSRAEYGAILSQALLASRRLEEALQAALQASEVAERTSVYRGDALVRAALACLELGDAANAARHARRAWEMGCRQWPDLVADELFGKVRDLRAVEEKNVLAFVVRVGGSSLANALQDLGRMEEALEVDAVVVPGMKITPSTGMLLRRGLDLHRRGDLSGAIDSLREAAEQHDTFWTYHAHAVERQRNAVDLLVRLLEERGTQADLVEAEERRAQVQRLRVEEEELRRAAMEDARSVVMAARAEERREVGASSSSRGGGKKQKQQKGRGGRRSGKKKAPASSPGHDGRAVAQTAAQQQEEEEEEDEAVVDQGPAAAAATGGPGPVTEAHGGGAGRAADETAVEEDGEDECPVCLRELIKDDDDDPLSLLSCGHGFHDDCVDAWIGSCQAKDIPPTCPMCRSSLVRL